YLNFVGKNFNTGNTPKLLIDLGGGQYSTWIPLTPADTTPATLAAGPYYAAIDCSKLNLLAIHRLVVSTGNGPVYNDEVTFDFSVVHPRVLIGDSGPKGERGSQGLQGNQRL